MAIRYGTIEYNVGTIGGQILMDGDNLKCHISATTVS